VSPGPPRPIYPDPLRASVRFGGYGAVAHPCAPGIKVTARVHAGLSFRTSARRRAAPPRSGKRGIVPRIIRPQARASMRAPKPARASCARLGTGYAPSVARPTRNGGVLRARLLTPLPCPASPKHPPFLSRFTRGLCPRTPATPSRRCHLERTDPTFFEKKVDKETLSRTTPKPYSLTSPTRLVLTQPVDNPVDNCHQPVNNLWITCG